MICLLAVFTTFTIIGLICFGIRELYYKFESCWNCGDQPIVRDFSNYPQCFKCHSINMYNAKEVRKAIQERRDKEYNKIFNNLRITK